MSKNINSLEEWAAPIQKWLLKHFPMTKVEITSDDITVCQTIAWIGSDKNNKEDKKDV